MRTPYKLLVLSCCAPCSCAVLKKLSENGTDVTVLFYNPNIYPSEEYNKRRDEQKRVCETFGLPFAELPYEPEIWDAAVSGLEQEPERGKRCSACFYMRLKKAAGLARKNGFDAFTSVLGVSRYKDLEQVNREAAKAALETGAEYDSANWRKNGLEELRRALIKELNLYSQQYCGCKYSIRDRQPSDGGKDVKI